MGDAGNCTLNTAKHAFAEVVDSCQSLPETGVKIFTRQVDTVLARTDILVQPEFASTELHQDDGLILCQIPHLIDGSIRVRDIVDDDPLPVTGAEIFCGLIADRVGASPNVFIRSVGHTNAVFPGR